jgi:hypothetical protein
MPKRKPLGGQVDGADRLNSTTIGKHADAATHAETLGLKILALAGQSSKFP